VADLIGFNRQLLELTLERVRRLELDDSGTLGGDLDRPSTAIIDTAAVLRSTDGIAIDKAAE
jgi:hypothetical protein